MVGAASLYRLWAGGAPMCRAGKILEFSCEQTETVTAGPSVHALALQRERVLRC